MDCGNEGSLWAKGFVCVGIVLGEDESGFVQNNYIVA
jgi:hypothetical protein